MMNQSDMISILERADLFKGFSPEQYARLATLAKEVEIKSGEIFIEEGSLSDQFYLIEEGTVHILKKDSGEKTNHHIATLKTGDIIGEIGLISLRNRDASACAITRVNLLAFPIKEFHSEQNRDLYLLLSQNISNILAKRLEFAYNVTVESMRNTLKQSRRVLIYQSVMMIVMLFILFQLGMSIYYIYHTNDFCKLKYNTEQPSITINRGIGL